MRYQRLINSLAIIVGSGLAAIGALVLVITASGNVSQGQAGLALSSVALLLAAAPILAVPFSVHIAKRLLLLALACFAVLTITLTFWSQGGATPSLLVQGAVIAFAVLFILRVFIRQHSKGKDPGK